MLSTRAFYRSDLHHFQRQIMMDLLRTLLNKHRFPNSNTYCSSTTQRSLGKNGQRLDYAMRCYAGRTIPDHENSARPRFFRPPSGLQNALCERADIPSWSLSGGISFACSQFADSHGNVGTAFCDDVDPQKACAYVRSIEPFAELAVWSPCW